MLPSRCPAVVLYLYKQLLSARLHVSRGLLRNFLGDFYGGLWSVWAVDRLSDGQCLQRSGTRRPLIIAPPPNEPSPPTRSYPILIATFTVVVTI